MGEVREVGGETVLTVSEVNRRARELIESAFPAVWVEGEIANFVRHASGHLYFSLRDANAQIRAAMFRGKNRFLRFEPENGLKVLARGSLTVYERGGQYQMVVDLLQPAGVGPLELAFQQIRRKLEAEGLFDPARKRPIPPFPRRVGIVTSASGAAIRDIVQILGRRAPWVELILRPTLVQGEGAAEDIARAVDEFNAYGKVDVLIVGRGGGSLEDLWAFNEEVVARSLSRSRIPVISAVGHEIDHTISDLVADLRAPTPSAAAELVAPDRRALLRDLADLRRRLAEGTVDGLRGARDGLERLGERWGALRFDLRVAERAQRPDDLLSRLVREVSHRLDLGRRDLASTRQRLDAVSPLAVLGRGYCLCRKVPGLAVVTRAAMLAPGDEVVLTFREGEAFCSVAKVEDSGG